VLLKYKIARYPPVANADLTPKLVSKQREILLNIVKKAHTTAKHRQEWGGLTSINIP